MKESYFDGSLLQLTVHHIIAFIIIVLSFGILAPFVLCLEYEWEIKHTVIEGKRLRFDGTAIGLFGHWIKWLLLTIITVGIYGFWLSIALKKWKTMHTHFA